ncbi:MAG: ArsB/NhaD family transporter [Pseudomonadaceae bacterium]|nr:ArsB/NhaD family transporter [Pseudomonadaceae bacterium]
MSFTFSPASLAILVFVATYVFLIWDRVNRAVIAMLAAGLLVLLGVMHQEEAFAAIDGNTIGLLLGMMVIVTITRNTGLFEYVALWCAQRVKADPKNLFVVMLGMTAVSSALLDNVTTVLLTTPVILSLTRQLKVNPMPYLIGSILASNIGGTATLIGDPPNIMIGSAEGLSFNDFIIHLAPLAVVVFAASLAPLMWLYRSEFHATDADRAAVLKNRPADAIKSPKLLKHCLFVLGLVMAGFVLHGPLHLEPATLALTGAALLLLLDNLDHDSEAQHHRVHRAIAEAEWVTLIFFMGLFVVVHGLVHTGIIEQVASWLLATVGTNPLHMAMGLLWGSAILSAFVDNIPFVATMIPLLQNMVPTFGGREAAEPLWWALAAGACLGGNGTLIGASANLVVAGLAAGAGIEIKFMKFIKVAFPLMILSIVIATAYIWLRYFM